MKAQLKNENVFTLTINGVAFPGLRQESKWEGFRKLVSRDAAIVVSDGDDKGPFSSFFSSIHDEDRGQEVLVIRATPDIWAELNKADRPAQEPSSARVTEATEAAVRG